MTITTQQAHAQVEFWGRACRAALSIAVPSYVTSGPHTMSKYPKATMNAAAYSAYANARAAARAALILFPALRDAS